jgi:hypothetical protein
MEINVLDCKWINEAITCRDDERAQLEDRWHLAESASQCLTLQ